MPLLPAEELAPRAAQHAADDVLDIDYLIDKRLADDRLLPKTRSARKMRWATLEEMSRFAVDPKWLVYQSFTAGVEDTILERA